MPVCARAGDVQEFLSKIRVRFVIAAPERGSRRRLGLPDAAHLGAEVDSLEVDGDPMGLQNSRNRLRDLPTHPLLDRESPGEEAYQPGELGDADDVLMGYVAHEGMAEERKGVVLAESVKGNRAFHHLAEI